MINYIIEDEQLIEAILALKDYFTKNQGITDYSEYMILTGVKTDLTECHGIKVLYDPEFPNAAALVEKDYYKVQAFQHKLQNKIR